MSLCLLFMIERLLQHFLDNELEVSSMYIYEDGKLPIGNPLLTFKKKDKTTLYLQTTVNTYRGKKGILYRVFVNGKKEISCLDLVISYKNDKVTYGRVYMKGGEEFSLKVK
ncbi:MAG: hypothetical protein Q9M40_08015 [Sulfurimonas sp.]|nr:hypothetical protein [Sulfurimonas sp.]